MGLMGRATGNEECPLPGSTGHPDFARANLLRHGSLKPIEADDSVFNAPRGGTLWPGVGFRPTLFVVFGSDGTGAEIWTKSSERGNVVTAMEAEKLRRTWPPRQEMRLALTAVVVGNCRSTKNLLGRFH
jgi:hypothetical protein